MNLRILTNRAKSRGTRESRSIPFSAFGEEGEPAVDPGRFDGAGHWAAPPRRWRSPEALAMQEQAISRLGSALEDLPPMQRAVVMLRDIDQLDAVAVCNILEISETNQRVLLHRARSKLRRVLEQHLETT